MKVSILKGLIALLFITIYISAQQTPSDLNEIGKVTKIIGESKIIRNADDKEEIAVLGMKVFVNDNIESSAESEVEITCYNNGALITIHQNSKIKLNAIYSQDNERKSVFSLFYGTIKAVVKKIIGTEEFSIQTPSAVVSVRGTSFDVSVSDLGESLVYVNEGKVFVEGDQNTSIAQQGNSYLMDIDKQIVKSNEKNGLTWIEKRNLLVKKQGLIKLKYLQNKNELFLKHLREIEKKINEIYANERFQEIKDKKLKNQSLSKEEIAVQKMLRAKIYVINSESIKTINKIESIMTIMLRIINHINVTDVSTSKMYQSAKSVILYIKEINFKLYYISKIVY